MVAETCLNLETIYIYQWLSKLSNSNIHCSKNLRAGAQTLWQIAVITDIPYFDKTQKLMNGKQSSDIDFVKNVLNNSKVEIFQ